MNNGNAPSDVKFVSYSGKWPCLCSGILVLEIAGERVSFGSRDRFSARLPDGKRPDYDKFWSTGGTCPMPPEEITLGEWKVDVQALPERFRKYAAAIDRALNDNVEHGCCGGCR